MNDGIPLTPSAICRKCPERENGLFDLTACRQTENLTSDGYQRGLAAFREALDQQTPRLASFQTLSDGRTDKWP